MGVYTHEWKGRWMVRGGETGRARVGVLSETVTQSSRSSLRDERLI